MLQTALLNISVNTLSCLAMFFDTKFGAKNLSKFITPNNYALVELESLILRRINKFKCVSYSTYCFRQSSGEIEHEHFLDRVHGRLFQRFHLYNLK